MILKPLLDIPLSKAYDVTWAAMEKLVEQGKTRLIGTYLATVVYIYISNTYRGFEFFKSKTETSPQNCKDSSGRQPGRDTPIFPSKRACRVLSSKRDSRHRSLSTWRSADPGLN